MICNYNVFKKYLKKTEYLQEQHCHNKSILFIRVNQESCLLNLFLASGPILYPLKIYSYDTSDFLVFSGGIKWGAVTRNKL